jgi:hypothetical protein
VDTSWVALSLGAQGDITKVVVTASDGRAEVVDGYEQGLNLARKWRNEWVPSDSSSAPSHTSGPWLPPLPGRPGDASDDAMPPVSPNEPPSGTRASIPPAAASTRRSTSPASSSIPPVSPSSPLSSVSKVSQPRPLSKSSQFPIPTLPLSDDRSGGESRDRWSSAPRPAGSSSRSMNKAPIDPSDPDHDTIGRPTGGIGRK